ncbi:MAG: hypothetical protein SFU84_15195 [Gemmatimonadales bacterium]|nr:hypothetical protein [Gemmatimonadales bacterium]
MRCLGRMVFAVFLLLLIGAGWLYRDELTRWGKDVVDPMAKARRTGRPSADAEASALLKVDSLMRFDRDSIVLSSAEMASLIRAGASFLPREPLDSISVELGDRTIRVRTMVNSAKLPERVLSMLPLSPEPFEEVIASGTLTPARAGVAEWRLERVLVRGLPVPSDLTARLIAKATGRPSDGRLEIAMPRGVTGFRVRPEGVAIYRDGTAP